MTGARASDIASLLAVQIENLAAELLPSGRREGREWRCGSVQGEAGNSLGIHLQGDKAGVWCDFSTGEKGDALDLVRAVRRVDTHEALLWSSRWLGLDPGRAERLARSVSAPKAANRERDRERRIRKARYIIRQCVPAAGTPVEAYLASRGLGLLGRIGFHPAAPHPDGFTMPAMVVPVLHVELGLVATHLTFLQNGMKAAIDRPKIIYGPCGGGAAHFGEPEPGKWLAIAEGIENAMTVAQAAEMPAWAALSAGGMEALRLPSAATHVIIVADHDEHGCGERAASVAARRWLVEGRRVRIAMPMGIGSDVNDVLLGRGAAAIEEARNVAA